MENFTSALPIILAVIGGIILLLVLMSGYVKAPTDKAYIISGLKKNPRVLIGHAGVKIPFLERKDELILRQVSIDIKTNGFIPTKDFIGVNIDAVAKIRVLTEADITIGPDGEFVEGIIDGNKKITKGMVAAAMKNFLNMSEDEIREALTDSLQGNMREIIGTQYLKELCNDRKKFGDEIQEKAQRDMNALGIWIESCNIQTIKDENDLINALGQDNMSQIQKDASVAKAAADRDVAIARAEADRAANEAEVASQTEIAMRNNELEIKRAELKKQADAKQAEADAAYSIQEQEQRKSVETATVNADIARQEREVELKQRAAEVKEQELSATIKKQAEAEKYRAEQQAQAELYRRQKEAEAKKYETAQQAEAEKLAAEARKYAKEQEAEGITAIGRAEAEAISAKGIAEAEALEKKAEAMAKYGQAAILEMVVDKLPAIAESVAKPYASIDNFMVIDSGAEGSAADKVGNLTAAGIASTRAIVKNLLDIDIKELAKAQTYDAKVNRNISVDGVDDLLQTLSDTKKTAVVDEKPKANTEE